MTKKIIFDSETSSRKYMQRSSSNFIFILSAIQYQGFDDANHHVVINKLVSTKGKE
jgi:hypothetical protein